MPILATEQLLCRLRGFAVPATPEERVRQAVIDQLLASHYPWHLLTCEVGHPALGAKAGRADLIFDLQPGPRAAMVIEVKARTLTEADAAQVHAYAHAFGVRVWALTDGVEWRVGRWTGAMFEPLNHLPAFGEWQPGPNTFSI